MTPLTYEHDTTRDIHIFRIHESSRAAIDAYAESLEAVAASLNLYAPDKPQAQQIRILLDFTETRLFPLQYLQQRIKVLFETFTVAPPVIFIAYITNDMGDKSLIGLLNYFSTVRREDIRRVFSADDYATALEWLTNKVG